MGFGVSDPGEKRIRVLSCSCDGRLESAALETSSRSSSGGGGGAGRSLHSSEADRLSSTRCARGAPGSPDSDLGPPTPLAGRENAEEEEDLLSASFEQNDQGAAGSVTECLTPTGAVFDPFAPAAEDLVFAPRKKMLKLPREYPRRELNFDLCDDCFDGKERGGAASEEEILLYKSFLDVIVKTQATQSSSDGSARESSNISAPSAEPGDESLKKQESILDDDVDALKTPSPPPPALPGGGFREEKLLNNDNNLDCSDALKTPTALPFSSRTAADTCPGAPIRPASKSRKLSAMGICRKLEF